MRDIQLNFSATEYSERLRKTRRAMSAAGIDLIIVTDPSNMAWLTGYDGWSFYVHQCVLISLADEPIWFGRDMDVNGARRTVYMNETCLIGYPDSYVQNPDQHPMDYLSGLITDWRMDDQVIGLELDNYYFSAACYQSLVINLPNATFRNTTGLVNWQRAIKSDQELVYMRRAARIVESMHAAVLDMVAPGVRRNELAAALYHAGIGGADGFGGDYPSIVPLLPTGVEASAPHLTWDDRPLLPDEGTFFEIAGCYRRYHCPLSRTVFLGTPPHKWLEAERALQEGVAAGLEQARPGNRAEDISLALSEVLDRYGLKKDNRCGYSIGLSYPPDWGERTISLRPGDNTILEAGMTFHFMPGLWFDDWGIEITESIVITENGAECLTNVPRQLFIKN